MRIYISGKVSGLDEKEVANKFAKAKQYCIDKYKCDVVDPVEEVAFDNTKTWQYFMKEDIKLLLDCDTIFMLEDWVDSRGAKVELGLAKSLDYDVIYEGNSEEIKVPTVDKDDSIDKLANIIFDYESKKTLDLRCLKQSSRYLNAKIIDISGYTKLVSRLLKLIKEYGK